MYLPIAFSNSISRAVRARLVDMMNALERCLVVCGGMGCSSRCAMLVRNGVVEECVADVEENVQVWKKRSLRRPPRPRREAHMH